MSPVLDVAEMLELLLAAGSRLDWRDRNGSTPLSLACSAGHCSLATRLVSLGANVRIDDDQGNLPLHHACMSRSCCNALVEKLLDAGSPVDQPNKYGLTALTYAILSKADTSVVYSLVSRGADPDVRVEWLRKTLLQLAVLGGDVEKACTLIRCGASPSTSNSEGESALSLALFSNRPLALWMLRAVAELACTAKAASVVHLTGLVDRAAHHTKANIGRPCASARFSRRSGRLLAVGCCDGSVLLWDVKQARPSASFQARSAAVTRLSFSNDDSFLAMAAADGTLCIYNMGTKHCSKSLAQPRDQMVLHPKYSCSGVALSPQFEALLATVGMDKRLVLFDLTSRRAQGSVQCAETLETVDFARDGRRVVVGGTSSKVYVYDLRNMAAPLVETLSGHVGPVGCVSCCQVAGCWKKSEASLQNVPLVTLTEVPPEMSCSNTPALNRRTQSDSVFERSSELHQEQQESPANGAAPQPPPVAPLPPHEGGRLPNDGPQREEVAAALSTLRGELDDGFENVHRHLSHYEFVSTRRHLAFRREVQGMLQQIFEEVLAIRRNLEEMQMDA
ncbi:hypothetical protein HPB47_022307 [Ixodes persulcatus]|uniref:Uncharacterized protein n=1 Tax=Ixodes persulcatus TaxID=34615 RepID=A0AC60QCE6_IXOPE|nr:hypothetical protein HPB47_022307 [Ixodes persulcatus]